MDVFGRQLRGRKKELKRFAVDLDIDDRARFLALEDFYENWIPTKLLK